MASKQIVVNLRCQDQTFEDQTFENIRAIIFDKDGTLANVEAYLKSLGQKRARLVDAQVPGVQEPLLLAFGVEASYLNPMGLMAVGSRHESEIAAAAYVAETGKDWAEALQITHTAFTEAEGYLKPKAPHTPLLPDIAPWLMQLAASGLKLGVLSADTSENIQHFLETYELASLITAYRSTDGDMSKPDPRLYMAMCHQLDLAPDQTLMVGDSTLDMKMARAAGAAGCIGVNWGWQTSVNIALSDCIISQPVQLRVHTTS